MVIFSPKSKIIYCFVNIIYYEVKILYRILLEKIKFRKLQCYQHSQKLEINHINIRYNVTEYVSTAKSARSLITRD